MARSSYIYVVHNITTGLILAAFTVKYECADWLHKRPGQGDNTVEILRFPDGKGYCQGVVIPLSEFYE